MGFPASPVHVGLAGGANGGTTAAIDTTGTNLLVAFVCYYNGGTFTGISDSNSNTWVQIGTTLVIGGSITNCALFYCASPTVGAGHTFTSSGSSFFPSFEVQAWSGAAATPLDQHSQNANNNQPGSVTPLQDNELLVTGCGQVDSDLSTPTVNLGFTISDHFNYGSGNNEPSSLAYLVQTTATAENPFWASGSTPGTIIATFKAAGTVSFVYFDLTNPIPDFLLRRAEMVGY